MIGFPNLPDQVNNFRSRIRQRDMLPTASRRRFGIQQENEIAITVAPPGTNTTADYSNIQDALNDINEIGGGTILLRPGTFNVRKQLTVFNNTKILGLTTDTSILDFGNSTTNNIILGRDNFELLDCYFSGFEAINCQHSKGTFYGQDAQNIIFDSIDFVHNVIDINIESASVGADRIFIEKCTSQDSGSFVTTDTSNSNINKIDGCTILDSTSSVFIDLDQFSITNNIIADGQSNIFSGLFSSSTISNNLVFWNDFTSSTAYLADFNNTDNCNIIGNQFIKNNAGHSGILDFDSNSSNNQIVGNFMQADNNTNPLIFFNGGGFNNVVGNLIDASTGSGADGIKITSSDQNVIVGNSIYGGSAGTTYAVNITDAASDFNKIGENILFGNTADTNDSGTSTSITDNI